MTMYMHSTLFLCNNLRYMYKITENSFYNDYNGTLKGVDTNNEEKGSDIKVCLL